jgi:methylase of polypeptide subunit release factors
MSGIIAETKGVRLGGLKKKASRNPGLAQALSIQGLGYTEEARAGLFDPDVPTACKHGQQVRALFRTHGYTQTRVGAFLPADPTSPRRVYSGNSFFDLRHSFGLPSDNPTPLEVLAHLFLFGFSLPRSEAEAALGPSLDTLTSSGLLLEDLVVKNNLVPAYQVFVLDHACFAPSPSDPPLPPVYVLTDWSLECLRPPKYAVMPVGYDSLELIACHACDAPPSSCRVLDLCCGGGTQGIAYLGWHSDLEPPAQPHTFADVNPRAARMCSANLALNFGAEFVGSSTAVVVSDAFGSVPGGVGGFHRVLCNPPFVAVPDSAWVDVPEALQPSLYASGGPDGNAVLRKIFGELERFLGEGGCLVMVTELPNVLSSCGLVADMIGEGGARADVRIAYCVPDVETVEEYVRAGLEGGAKKSSPQGGCLASERKEDARQRRKRVTGEAGERGVGGGAATG